MDRVFLNAEWRKLVMANYIVDADLLRKYIPAHTELDFWNGKCYVSLVGFMFQNTKVLGLKIPFHINFEEVNLRFYVKYCQNDVCKRGVVFIKEIVPRHAITLVANTLYNEHYQTFPMKHLWNVSSDKMEISYSWKKHTWHSISVVADTRPLPMGDGSEEEFITEHFWGYTKQTETKTSEYEVAHPRWVVYPVHRFDIQVDYGQVYGSDFTFLNQMQPVSVYLAEGSEILVKKGAVISS